MKFTNVKLLFLLITLLLIISSFNGNGNITPIDTSDTDTGETDAVDTAEPETHEQETDHIQPIESETPAPETEDTLPTETYIPETTAIWGLTSEEVLWDKSLDYSKDSYSTNADRYEEDPVSGYLPRDNDGVLEKLGNILRIYTEDSRVAVAAFLLWDSDMEVYEKPIFDGKCLSDLSDEYGQLVQERYNIEMRICENNSCSREEAQQYAEYIEADRQCNEAYELLINAEKQLEYLRWEPTREYLRSFGVQIEYDYYSDNPADIDCYMEFLSYRIVFTGTVEQVTALISDLESGEVAFSLGFALDNDLYDEFVKVYGDPHTPPFLINGEIADPHE